MWTNKLKEILHEIESLERRLENLNTGNQMLAAPAKLAENDRNNNS